MHACKMHAYKMHACERCTARSRLSCLTQASPEHTLCHLAQKTRIASEARIMSHNHRYSLAAVTFTKWLAVLGVVERTPKTAPKGHFLPPNPQVPPSMRF